ncbi:endonuclease/exonuclease/phosphatase family protein [Alloscardovia omnicolens]|uniref:endonuclease/exonuclease/phosphatase family protein n=1 Tax=Alloscardovia omnicolens TaxID=419015 RepID=UPI003A69BCF1
MIIWFFLIIIALWMSLRYLPAGADAHNPLPYAIALIPLLAIPLIALLGWSVFSHQRAHIWVSIGLLAMHLLWSLTFYVPLPAEVMPLLASPRQTFNSAVSTENTGEQQFVTVMTVNARYGHADTSVIMHTIKQMNIDVLAVQEVSDDFVQRLHDAGISQIMAFEQLGEKTEHDNAGYNALWSRYPATQSGSTLLEDMGSQTPWMHIQVNNHAVRIVSTHPYSPQRGAQQWHHDIASLGQLATGADVPTIVMGDLNSSVFHPSLRATINAGLVDSSLELHRGAHVTFPSSWFMMPSMIEIDHVLHTRELTATQVQTAVIPRTDHKALIARITWR